MIGQISQLVAEGHLALYKGAEIIDEAELPYFEAPVVNFLTPMIISDAFPPVPLPPPVNFTWYLGGSLNKEVIYYDTESVQRRSTGDIAMKHWTSCGFGDGNLF